MSGEMIFEAITEIDDELIESSRKYRPEHAIRFNLRHISTAAAAVLIIVAGTFAYNAVIGTGSKSMAPDFGINQTSNGTADCVITSEVQKEEGREESLMNDAAPASGTYIEVGELEGYKVLISKIEEEYVIYISKDDIIYKLEDSPLEAAKREEAVGIVNDYLKEEETK